MQRGSGGAGGCEAAGSAVRPTLRLSRSHDQVYRVAVKRRGGDQRQNDSGAERSALDMQPLLPG
jgi:hypothetical protein